MTRRGVTLLELTAYLAIAVGVVGIAGELTVALIRRQVMTDGRIFDLTCDRLRRDLERGGHAEGEALVAGGHRWRFAEGHLSRDGAALFTLGEATWIQDGTAWRVVLRPVHGPARTLRILPEQKP